MSETAPERPARGGGNVFTTKLGPLPMWAWAAIASAVLIGWAYYRNKQAASATAANSSAGASTPASDIPQFVNQTYTTVTPPTVTAPTTVNVSTPAPGASLGTTTPILTPGLPATAKPVAPRPSAVSEPIFNASYTVLKGETLASVAKKYGISREQLAHANGLGTGAGLRTGQKLKVPSPAPGGTPNKAI
jgi:LysM repeat protein